MDAKEDEGRKALSRRSFALGVGGAVALLGLGGAVKLAQAQPVCRPPGGQDEASFIAACLRCEKCREACPMGVIVSARLETGLLNTRTPTFDFKLGWCDFCKSGNNGTPRCIEVCPTQALNLPAGADPEKSVLGIAYIVKDWCLGWQLKGCKTCYNECPFDAITLDYADRPLIDATLCNGCGRCEEVCPSAQATSYTVGATDRAITIKPVEVFEQLMTASGEATRETTGERGLL